MIALSIMAAVVVGIQTDGDASVTMSDDWSCYADGMYVRFDGMVTVKNTYRSGLDDTEISVGFCDQKTGEVVPIWSEKINVPANSSVDIPVNITVSSFALSAAIIDSINTTDSPFYLHVDVHGKCMYGTIDTTVSLYTGVDLAKDGTTVGYTVIQNDDAAYRIAINNLSERIYIPEDIITMVSGIKVLVVNIHYIDGDPHIIVTGNDSLDVVLKTMEESVTGVHTESGTEIDTEQARDIAAIIDYARWLL